MSTKNDREELLKHIRAHYEVIQARRRAGINKRRSLGDMRFDYHHPFTFDDFETPEDIVQSDWNYRSQEVASAIDTYTRYWK